jgi:hypothetical protein
MAEELATRNLKAPVGAVCEPPLREIFTVKFSQARPSHPSPSCRIIRAGSGQMPLPHPLLSEKLCQRNQQLPDFLTPIRLIILFHQPEEAIVKDRLAENL